MRLGTAIISRSIAGFRSVFPLFQLRFITASWPFKLVVSFREIFIGSSFFHPKATDPNGGLNPNNGGKSCGCAILFSRQNAAANPQT
jgi:hypothetical protein